MTGILELRTWLLANYQFLSEEDLEFFRPHLIEKQIGKDEHVLASGRCCREVSFIVSGAFRMYHGLGGKEINSHFFVEHDFMADYGSLLGQAPSRYSIQALEPSQIVSISHDALMYAYEHSKNWERVGRLMAEHYAGIFSGRLEQFLFMGGQERYRCLLQTNPHIFDRVPLYHLASYLGMERESLSRIRQRLSRA